MIKPKLERFKENVLLKFNIFNSLFTTLPFGNIKNISVLLPLLQKECISGFEKGLNPEEIIINFFNKYTSEKDISLDLLFDFIKYIERQVVLFDAIEESAFPVLNNLDGVGTLRNAKEKATEFNKIHKIRKFLKEAKVRIVLTAHPTQFYPGKVLGIITDLSKAVLEDDFKYIRDLLTQLGKTPFFNHQKPTPLDEAFSLIWYLENILYKSVGNIYNYIQDSIYDGEIIENEILEVGFWPGGDRDGNPYVTSEITEKVAEKLRISIIRKYQEDVKLLKRRLTFREVEPLIENLQSILDNLQILNTNNFAPLFEIKNLLYQIKNVLIEKHQSLFLDDLQSLINKVQIFGLHFASLDIRQDSRVINAVYEERKMNKNENNELLGIAFDTIESMNTIKKIQNRNGEKGCHRYIISNTQNSKVILQVYEMLSDIFTEEQLTVDIVPLFETIDDLFNADFIMNELYMNPLYTSHLNLRRNKQYIMLGFSDGTKDGGYLRANFSIYEAKEKLSESARKNGIEIVFFDGRGGPPARGGGRTHQFYASLGKNIQHKEIHLTVQGQTISSHYGSEQSAQFNIEQLLSASIENAVFSDSSAGLSVRNRDTLNKLAEISFKSYQNLKNDPKFTSYLENISTLKYYSQTNIGSRPVKRANSDKLEFSDLRAIPFVGSWSLLKQNVPGFYGVGTALKFFLENGNWDEVQSLYDSSLFFKTLIENSAMSIKKSFFPLTEYIKNDKEYGDFWNILHDEYMLSKKLILKLSRHLELMENYPERLASIDSRNEIVLPLLTIQQFALKRIREYHNENHIDKKLLEKLVIRSLFGNVNASRNST